MVRLWGGDLRARWPDLGWGADGRSVPQIQRPDWLLWQVTTPRSGRARLAVIDSATSLPGVVGVVSPQHPQAAAVAQSPLFAMSQAETPPAVTRLPSTASAAINENR